MVNGFKVLLSSESAILPLFIYAFAKLLIPIKNDTNILLKMPIHLFRIILTLVGTPLLMLVLLLFACYFELVTFFAKLHFGKVYYDNIAGADAMWTYNSPECKSVVHILSFLNDDPNTPKKMVQMFRDPKLLDVILRNHPRLLCLRKSFLGYTFLVKIDVDYSKVVRYFDDYNTLEEFHEIANCVTKADLPYGGEFMWELLIGKNPVQVHPGKCHYPMMYRFHHSTTDGMSISTFVLTSFIKNGMEKFKTDCEQLNQIFAKNQKPKEPFTLNKFINKCLAVLNRDVYCHFDMVYSKEQPNILKSNLTGEKIVAFSFEKQDEKLIEKIKKTKNILKVSFADVVLSAVSASLAEFYKTRGGEPPTEVTTLSPYFLYPGKLEDIVTINANGEPVTKFGNRFAISVVELPVDCKLLEKPTEIITKVNETTQDVKKSIDFALTYSLFNIFLTIMPRLFATIVTKCFHSSVIITNVPGVKEITFLNDCLLEDVVVWTNNFQKTGVTFTFFSYNNSLRLTTHVDRGLIDNVQDVQALSDGVLRYIQVLYEQTCNGNFN